MMLSHDLLKAATAFYGVGCVTALLLPQHRQVVVWLLPALGFNAVAVAWRYQSAWPMLPMYLAPSALPLALGVTALLAGRRDPSGRVRAVILALALIAACTSVLFPKDYYLPFVKSRAAAAHLFLVFGVVGRSCFLASAAWALHGLFTVNSGKSNQPAPDHFAFRWAVWGFGFWTLSMFAGEWWSYLGWGTPVVWDDPAITSVMATWFYYVGYLHLHLTGTWTPPARSIYAASGIWVVLFLNCLPEWGPFRCPF